VRMLIVPNGRCGFGLVDAPENLAGMPDRDATVKMLQRECELRTSAEISDSFDSLGDDYPAVHRLHEDVQRQVCKEFGFGSVGPIAIQSARARFPDDTGIVESAFYLKYNRARQGALCVGDKVPDVPLLELSGKPTSLLSYHSARGVDRPLVVIAGSTT